MIIFFYRNSAVIRVLADILRESGKEKVTRIIIAALRVSLVKTVFEYSSFLCWILRRRRRFFVCFRRAEASAKKVCEKREESVRGECTSGGAWEELPLLYWRLTCLSYTLHARLSRAPLTRASHARLSRASLTRVSHARLSRAPTRLKTEKTTFVQHLILKREMPEFKMK